MYVCMCLWSTLLWPSTLTVHSYRYYTCVIIDYNYILALYKYAGT